MNSISDFSIGDRVKIVSYGATQAHFIGASGDVVGFDRMYVMINNLDIGGYSGSSARLLCLPSELEIVVDETEPVDDDDYLNGEGYAIRAREGSSAFEFYVKATGEVLIVTQFVSLDTLMRIAEDHGNR